MMIFVPDDDVVVLAFDSLSDISIEEMQEMVKIIKSTQQLADLYAAAHVKSI